MDRERSYKNKIPPGAATSRPADLQLTTQTGHGVIEDGLPHTPTPNSTRPLLSADDNDDSHHTAQMDCLGNRKLPVGERCFTLIIVMLISGFIFTSFGATCLMQTDAASTGSYFCEAMGGLAVAVVLICGGVMLLLVSIATCVIINECSGRELHGGKCHINCHIFEDLVV